MQGFEKLIDLAKIFLEKYFVPTILSGIFAILSYAFLPFDFVLRQKLNDVMFFVLLLLVWFIAILIIIAISKQIKIKEPLNK